MINLLLQNNIIIQVSGRIAFLLKHVGLLIVECTGNQFIRLCPDLFGNRCICL